MPGYSSTHVIFATRFGSIDRDFRLDGKEVHLPAGVAHFLGAQDVRGSGRRCLCKVRQDRRECQRIYQLSTAPATCSPPPSSWTKNLDVLLGMVTHPYFTEQTIAKEQGIIGQEIKMYDDSPDWRLITGLFECLYHSHPIRSDIAGTVESIAEITPEMLYDSCKAFYAPGNMVLAAAGNTTMEQILAACERHGLMDAQHRKRSAAVEAGAHDAGGPKDPRNAGGQALLRPGLQGRAAAFRRPAQRDAVRAHPLLRLRRDVAALPPPVRRGPDQPRLWR